jgi:ketosteroid isomerase-like protein
MSDEHLEKLRRVFERWAEGDLSAGADDLDPEIVFVVRPPFMPPGVHVGPGKVADYMRDLIAQWDRYTIELTEIRAAGDTVLTRIRQRGTGRTSGVQTDLDSFMVFTFRAGKIIRIDNLVDEVEALTAAGFAPE